MRPGTNVTTQTAPPPITPPVNTGTWFVAGIASQGPTGSQQPVTSFQQYQQVYGQRGTTPLLSDCIETYFKEGGSVAYVARVVGPAATAAHVNINDGSAAPAIAVSAIGPGVYANGYQIVIAASGGTYTITVQDASSNVLETSVPLTTNADAVGYGQTSQYVTVKSIGSGVPVAGTSVLAGGSDDLTHVVDASYTGALAAFPVALGPGQVSIPGQTDTTVVTALFTHAQSNNRVAVADCQDVNTSQVTSASAAATLTAAAAPITALGAVARNGGLFSPWIDIQAVPGSTSLRPVPPCAFVAAKCAQVDALGNPNVPAAGKMGALSTVVGLHAVYADIDRQNLNSAGVNVIKPVYQSFRVYGFRSATNPNTDPNYWQLNNIRLDMAIIARAQAVQEDFVFSQIDGQGLDATQYGNELKAMLSVFYTLGALFGATPQDAYTVDTGADVNTPASEAAGTLAATIACKRSPEAELVNLNIVRVAITQAV